jgi:hypothetical protein
METAWIIISLGVHQFFNITALPLERPNNFENSISFQVPDTSTLGVTGLHQRLLLGEGCKVT